MRLFEEGVAAAKAENWPKARAAFLRAWELKQHWQIAANLGRAELMLKRYCDAVEHLTYVLKEAKELSETDRQQMQEMLDKALAKVGSLTVQVDVTGADVLVDEKPIGKSPVSKDVCVEVGTRTVEARQEGREPARQSVDVKAGSTRTVELRLSLESSPTSLQARERAQKSDRNDTPESTSAGTKVVVLGAGVTVTALSLGLGVGSIAYAMSSKSYRDEHVRASQCDYNNLKSCRNEFESSKRDADVFLNVALWSFIAAGVGGAVTTVCWLAMPESVKQSKVSASASFGDQGGGVAIRYRW